MPPAPVMEAAVNDVDGRCHAMVMQPSPLLDLCSSISSSSKVIYRPLGLCTEGLGSESSESSGDGDLASVVLDDTEKELQYHCQTQQQHCDSDDDEQRAMARRRTRGRRAFPPPISVIGAAGKPWQYLRAHRGDGRLVLREVRIPSRELLQACREDGRLMLHFAHSDE